MGRAYYSASLDTFLRADPRAVRDRLAGAAAEAGLPTNDAQLGAWTAEIRILQDVLPGLTGTILLETSIPRMGRRIDAVILAGRVVFVVEFKVGEHAFHRAHLDQVWDYALDLKNFHQPSHDKVIVPILVPTEADPRDASPLAPPHQDGTHAPWLTGPAGLRPLIDRLVRETGGDPIDGAAWEAGRYRPTPTIVEAATAMYRDHGVQDIARREADDQNLGVTSARLAAIIEQSRAERLKSVCFVTGVPGAGKTLVGLDTATRFMDAKSELYSVFLSGNGPLVRVLCEALARDKVRRDAESGVRTRLGDARRAAAEFIQNVHHFRDDGLRDEEPPAEHVALFDEAQRAWNHRKTADFMKRKRGRPGFTMSEPEFLLSCMDRHRDWAVVVCLVGGGQEINDGEAGITEWAEALHRGFPDWHVHHASRLTDAEFGAGAVLGALEGRNHVTTSDELHLATSQRSFRAEHLSRLVKQLLDRDVPGARESLGALEGRYPLVLTRSLDRAKRWLKSQARGSERYGIVVSSQAERLRPHAIAVKAPMDPVHWFLDGKEDVRSSYYLEDVATEFSVQGLELDWTCVTWDADLRHSGDGWSHWSFVGDRWNRIRKEDRRRYQLNAYRVLMTRARQGMVIVVPEGDAEDATRDASFYDPSYEYLRGIGLPEL